MGKTKRSSRTKPISENVKLLRQCRALAKPTCCDQPMAMRFLHVEKKTDEQTQQMTESEYADHFAGAILPPVWECDKCEKELELEGIAWPEPKADEPEPEPKIAPKPMNFCPQCGCKLTSGEASTR